VWKIAGQAIRFQEQSGEMRILLVDRNAPLAAAWRETFRDHPEVEVTCGDFFSLEADAMVSPANSFGIMDGGLDAVIHVTIGPNVQSAVWNVIREKHHGEIPVGAAEIVATDDVRWPFLVCAPTMRVPEDVSRTLNAYLAFRAILLAVQRHKASSAAPIRSLLCPGLGTGVGAMPPRRCAAQMRVAYRQVRGSPDVPSFETIHATHRAMRTAD
jgi:O-acetyl-ADP-ribose deacetylase (regulator of RNase III)